MASSFPSLLVVLACCVVAAFAASPPFPCTFTDSFGRSYDLSNAWRDASAGQSDYAFKTSSYSYLVNLCGETTTTCSPSNGVCQIDSTGIPRGCGDAANAEWSTLSDGTDGVALRYPSGTSCSTGPRTTYLNVTCDATLSADAVIDSVSETTMCTYNISMRSRWACSQSNAASSGSKSIVTYLTGGLPFCTQCGASGAYACSNNVGNWPSSYMFADPVPKGSVVSRVDVTLLGSYACTYGYNVIEVDINGVPINAGQSAGSSACACNTCDGAWTFSAIFAPFNLPYYAYGATNNVTVQLYNGATCLNNVNITVYWDPPQYPGTLGSLVRFTAKRYTSPQVCNSAGYDSSSSISFSFTDPLPSGSLLLMANTQVFGSFWCYSSSSLSPTITTTLQGTRIGLTKLASRGMSGSCSSAQQCDGSIWTPSSQLYQSGWPNYRYGTSNTLVVDTTYYPRIGQVALYLTYYNPNSADASPKVMEVLVDDSE